MTGDVAWASPMNTIKDEAAAQDTRDPALLLASFQRTASERLLPALDAALRRVDDFLFDRANEGAEGVELTALRDLRRARAPVTQGFEQALLLGFRRLQGLTPALRTGLPELSLLSEDGLEEQLATEQLVAGLSRMHAPALELLDKRLAALLQRPALGPGENPIGPVRLAEAMAGALASVELGTSVRIVLYKFLERELHAALAGLYERVNASLAAAGILPHLRPVARAEPAPPAMLAPGTPASELVSAALAAAAAPAPLAAADPAMQGPGDQALFSSLIGLLQSWRQSVSPRPEVRTGQTLQSRELLSVLSWMQADPPQRLEQALGDERISLADQLHREVLASARRMGMGDDEVSLSNTDEDAVDLVGMLFDVLLDERDFEPEVRRRIGRMLVPYVKVAITDRRMFLFKGHPARRLLNAVAEACEGNHGEGPQERELLERVDATIDRLVAEFNEDIAIFEALEQELRAYMAQQRKRIELAERRAAESQSGRERLEQARAEATADLARHRDTRDLPPALDEFVTTYGGHHLTQVALRDGRDSPRYGASLRAIERVLMAFHHAELGTPPERLPPLEHEPLHGILASSGCVGPAAEDALAIIQRTLAQLAAGEEGAAQAAHLPEQRVAAPVPEPESELALVAGHATLDYDPALAERMRALEIGTWLQLTSESGRTEPAKVSWVSPISARLLFVNRRGIRVLVASAEELAAMAKLGKVQLREADTAFEDAMHQVIGRLKSGTQSA